ncbi:hypothetical protein QBC43DRAFT_361683 [Cladorrhinum sp. PSN259]|nr:hypothetical protein QBC43DRAFT_361683 [Cladorrhinum sp. PSN259]
MASVDGESAVASLLASKTITPIAQLNPDLPAQASLAVRGEVGIKWPYNSVTKTLAFLVAEPDVRLRRAKGQVRIELHGPSAKAFSNCEFGAGDELLLNLDGVEWAKDTSPGRIPGSRVDWQLQFREKLTLQIKSGESGKLKYINVDQPDTEPEPIIEPPVESVTESRFTTPEAEDSPEDIPNIRKFFQLATNEYSSPAFVKRARISYGALYEGDIFEDDGGVKNKGRKRARFGRNSGAWRYTSQSPSAGPSSPVQDAMDEDIPEAVPTGTSPKVQTMDEGCQTVDSEMMQDAPALIDNQISKVQPVVAISPVKEDFAITAEEQHGSPRRDDLAILSHAAQELHEATSKRSEEHIAQEQPVQEQPTQEQHPLGRSPVPNDGLPRPGASFSAPLETSHSTLFGSKPAIPSYSMFGTSAPARAEPTMSIADQVRFGFSHIPETHYSAAIPEHHPHGLKTGFSTHDTYPASYLDAHASANYPEINPYLDAAGSQQSAGLDHGMAPHPPIVESFGHGQWEVSTQSQFYNPVEGGHFGTDALDEGSRITSEQPSLHATEISPDRVPQGFATYGGGEVPEERPGEFRSQQLDVSTSSLVEAAQKSANQVEIVDLSEEDVEDDGEHDEYESPVEEGDYDQRKYQSVSDDDEGLSEEEEEVEQEMGERYGDGEIYDEDGEPWNEDEEGFEDEEEYDEEEQSDESEEDEEGYENQSRPSYPQQSYGRIQPSYQTRPSSGPVVISLLSDSEDDDEPDPAPAAGPALREASAAEEPVEQDANSSSSIESDDDDTPPDSPHVEPQPSQDDFEPNNTVQVDEENDDSNSALENTDVVDFAENKELGEQARAAEADSDGGQESFLSSAVGEELEASQYDPEDTNEVSTESKHVDAEGENVDDESTGVVAEEKSSANGEDDSANAEEVETNAGQQPTETIAELSTTDAQHSSDNLSDDGNEPVPSQSKADVKNEEQPTEPPAPVLPPEADDSSGYASDDKDSSFASQVEIVEEMDVGEEEQDKETTPQGSAPVAQDSFDGATDDKTMSFATQIEPDEQDEQDEQDEEMDDASEDDVMVDDDIPIGHQEETKITEETWESEDVEIIDVIEEDDDDVAMLDAATPVLSAGVEDDDDVDMLQAQESESRGESEAAGSGPVTTEYISEVIVTEEVTTVEYTITQPSEEPEEFSAKLEEKPDESVQEESAEQPVKEGDDKKALNAVDAFSPPLTNSFASQPLEHEKPRKGHQPLTPLQSQPVEEEVSQAEDDVSEDAFSDAVEQLEPLAEEDQEAEAETAEVEELVDDQAVDSTQEEGTDEVSQVEPESEVEEVVPQASALSPPTADVEEDEVPSVEESEVEESASSIEDDGGAVRSKQATVQDAIADEETAEPEVEPETPLQVVTTPGVVKDIEDTEDRVTVSTPSTQGHRSPEPESDVDHSVNLARQAVPTTRRSKKAAASTEQPTRISPRLARGRSNSLHTIATDEGDNSVNLAKGALAGTPSKDISISLAKGALDSPSKRPTASSADTATPSSSALKSELVKRLRTELPECVNLKSLRYHNDKYPNIVAIVTTEPSPPARAKGGPREYSMTFYVTDPSIAPKDVVEVQLYRPHKDHLPVLKVGDAILLQRVQVKSLSKKGHGLRSGQETAWAVFDEDEGPPQIKGLPVEDWEGYRAYMTGLRGWWRGMGEGEKSKVEEKGKKMKET